MDIEPYIPLAIIGTGGFISFLIVVYYVVKTFARTQGLMEAGAEPERKIDKIPNRSYTITFRNGTEHKFGGVKLEVVTEEYDDNVIESLEYIHEGDEDLSEEESELIYNQSQLFIDKSQILTIVETRTPKYSI